MKIPLIEFIHVEKTLVFTPWYFNHVQVLYFVSMIDTVKHGYCEILETQIISSSIFNNIHDNKIQNGAFGKNNNALYPILRVIRFHYNRVSLYIAMLMYNLLASAFCD